jgi:hypothetical protein
MSRRNSGPWVAAVAVVGLVIGLFGTAFAISGLASPLPLPAARGTCGPGRGSEAAAIAFFDPVTIGAGAEPPASKSAERAQWIAFVHECQSAADQRVAITLPVLVVSVALVVGGGVLLWRRRTSADPGPPHRAPPPPWSPPPGAPPRSGFPPAPLLAAAEPPGPGGQLL